MGVIGHGYGSEWHLLRYMGRHRNLLGEEVLLATGGYAIGWLDFHFCDKAPWWDAERVGLDFLPDGDPIRRLWSEFWPQSGTAQNWDAVGVLQREGATEWLLVEAKSHVAELQSDCKAKPDGGGRAKIEEALATVKDALGVSEESGWLHGYYQHANRLAALWFLNSHSVPSRLLDLYFVGDDFKDRVCPPSPLEWEDALERMGNHLGLPASHALSDRVHTLFLDVRG